jgi:hypothetical protein
MSVPRWNFCLAAWEGSDQLRRVAAEGFEQGWRLPRIAEPTFRACSESAGPPAAFRQRVSGARGTPDSPIASRSSRRRAEKSPQQALYSSPALGFSAVSS